MLRKGQHVEQLTRKVGQRTRTGVVVGTQNGSVEVRWDDGHTSIVSGGLIRPVSPPPKG